MRAGVHPTSAGASPSAARAQPIPLQDRRRIFEPYQRGRGERRVRGGGLGLSICREIVERHGGQLRLTASGSAGNCLHLHAAGLIARSRVVGSRRGSTGSPVPPRARGAEDARAQGRRLRAHVGLARHAARPPAARRLPRRHGARPSPSLFPAEAHLRVLADAAERWGDEVFRWCRARIIRWGLVQHVELRRWISEQSGVPGAGVSARLSVPAAVYYARAVGADEPAVRRALEGLPGMLDRVDALLSDGVLVPAAPTGRQALQVLCSVRPLGASPTSASRSQRAPPLRPHREFFPPDPAVSRRSCRASGSLPLRAVPSERDDLLDAARPVGVADGGRQQPGLELDPLGRWRPTSTRSGSSLPCSAATSWRPRRRAPPTPRCGTPSCSRRRRSGVL